MDLSRMKTSELWERIRKAQKYKRYFRDEVWDPETSDSFSEEIDELYAEIMRREPGREHLPSSGTEEPVQGRIPKK